MKSLKAKRAKKMSEILAPAGSFESLVAAVRCGADAVYLGAENFNARGNATRAEAAVIFSRLQKLL